MFQPFQKIPRLNRDCCITEKLDGSNASISIVDLKTALVEMLQPNDKAIASKFDENGNTLLMFAGSRTRFITPEDDNYGFARWARDAAEQLWGLGLGRHYGEWWGQKIQRGYGLEERRFSLFNTARWYQHGSPTYPGIGKDNVLDQAGTLADGRVRAPYCCSVVPVLYRGPFSSEVVDKQVERLRTFGSFAVPGYRKPEGIVVWHEAAQSLFKVTLEGDARPKGQPSAPEPMAVFESAVRAEAQ